MEMKKQVETEKKKKTPSVKVNIFSTAIQSLFGTIA